jgi:hypothetical protein
MKWDKCLVLEITNSAESVWFNAFLRPCFLPSTDITRQMSGTRKTNVWQNQTDKGGVYNTPLSGLGFPPNGNKYITFLRYARR